MNDISSLRDFYIADELIRIKKLTRYELVQELIELKTVEIESLDEGVLLNGYGKRK
jgi:hypothetical protein